MELRQEIKTLSDKARSIRIELRKAVLSLPDNTEIQRIDEKCYTINSSIIMKSKNKVLSPSYYDFKYQYRELLKALELVDVSKYIDVLTNCIDTGHIRHGEPKNWVVLHPEVIKQIKQIIN